MAEPSSDRSGPGTENPVAGVTQPVYAGKIKIFMNIFFFAVSVLTKNDEKRMMQICLYRNGN
jgi:hypothetical protein